jgi:carboxypeptidase Taq
VEDIGTSARSVSWFFYDDLRPKAGDEMSYTHLTAHYRKLNQLVHCSRIVAWDEAVMMPGGAGESRADAIATLEGVIHERATDPRIAEWLEQAAREPLDDLAQASLREMTRVYRRATALPADLVEAQSRAQLRCEQAWRTQRRDNDWAGHLPLLTEVIRLKREEAAVLSERLGLSAYDALVDAYEPGMRSEQLDVLFGELEGWLPGRVAEIVERQARTPVERPVGPFPLEQQRALGLELMAALGFDFDHGRLDTSHHPFCGGVPSDVRVTTRYDVGDFTESLMGILHETGHAKYEQGLPRALAGLPIGEARSMGVHESQSLFQEMQICRGLPFLRFAAPRIRRAFPAAAAQAPATFSAENLHRLYTRVQPGLIRVDADEVTYPLHVILRYRIERGLIEGRIEPRQLPEHWDAAMRRMLQRSTAGNDRDGCMQDVHWPSGAFGYFPSYTLGALIAAQLFESAARSLGGLDDRLAAGDFEPLNAFLRTHVWERASVLETQELVERASGQKLGTDAFKRHVLRRYLSADIA